MAHMHELLAVESDVQGQLKLIMSETDRVFKDKSALFQGSHRKLVVFDDNDKTVYPEENQALTSTVEQRLDYTAKAIVKCFDIMLQKESTNQKAVANIVVDGEILAENVPATFLLGLETKLKEVRSVYANIPTLQVGIDWEEASDLGKGIYRMKFPEEKLRTELKFRSQVLYEATEHHKAEIEKWQEQVPTGKFVKSVWSGMFTSAEKHKVLTNIDKLISAVKQARQRANMQEVVGGNIGKKLIKFINGEGSK